MRVAGGRNQAEAEFIQGMLLEEGVPSILRRSAGFDVPDFLAAGPRDVLVPQAGAEAAREVLLEAEMAPQEAPQRSGFRVTAAPARLCSSGGALDGVHRLAADSERVRLATFLAPRLEPLYGRHAATAARARDAGDGEDFEALFDGSLDGAFICGLPYVRLRERGPRRSSRGRSPRGTLRRAGGLLLADRGRRPARSFETAGRRGAVQRGEVVLGLRRRGRRDGLTRASSRP